VICGYIRLAQILDFRFSILSWAAKQSAIQIRYGDIPASRTSPGTRGESTRRHGGETPDRGPPALQKFLKVEEHRLRLKHQSGGGGREICARRAELIDVLLQYVFAAAATATRGNSTSGTPLALIALGGYGRGELNPFSDIDVMFLHHQGTKKISPHLEEMGQQVLYLLWDSGFKVGHSTRSIKEAIAQANRDMRTKTAMLESRFPRWRRRTGARISATISFEVCRGARAGIR